MSSKLDFQQILKAVYDSTEEALRTTSGSVGGSSAVSITGIDTTDVLNVAENFEVLTSVDTLAASINAVTGSFTQVVASLAADCVLITPYETTGKKIGLYTGALSSEVLQFIIGPGQDTPMQVNIPAGTRISIRSTENPGPSAGSLILTFTGRG